MKKQEIKNWLNNALDSMEEFKKEGKTAEEILSWIKHDINDLINNLSY